MLIVIEVCFLVGCGNNDTNKTRKNVNVKSSGDIVKEVNNKIVLKLNTEGLGQVSYFIDDENQMEFDDEYPAQSAATIFRGEKTVTVGAKADEGWKFDKWIKDGEDYSNEEILDIVISGDTELIAVFENSSL